MMLQGLIWQQLRQKALATIPNGIHLSLGQPQTLATWLRTGAYQVTSSSPQSYVLSASTTEMGGALVSEAALHLDHATEHAVSVRHQLSSGRWYSAAWLCVTFYYWLFFLVVSITRMLGRTGVFLSKADAHFLQSLAGLGASRLGAGPAILECGPSPTASVIEVKLAKASRSRLHDLMWRLMFEQIRESVNLAKTSGADQSEMRLFNVLNESSKILGPTWPSDLRNLANYVPGRGYRAVRRDGELYVFGAISVDPCAEFNSVLNQLEDSVASFSLSSGVTGNMASATRALVFMTFALDRLAQALHAEVNDRRHLDARWQLARDRFRKQQFEAYTDHSWPCGLNNTV
jgi:hypothetical protein